MWRAIALILLGVIAAITLAGSLFWFGLHLGPIGIEGERNRITRLQREVVEMHMAGELAIAQQNTANKAIEAAYSAMAQRSQHAHQKALADARSAVSRYVADHSLDRVCRQGTGGGSPADQAGLPVDPPPPAGPDEITGMVAIRTDELEWLTEAAMLGAEQRERNVSLVNDGFAVAVDPPAVGF